MGEAEEVVADLVGRAGENGRRVSGLDEVFGFSGGFGAARGARFENRIGLGRRAEVVGENGGLVAAVWKVIWETKCLFVATGEVRVVRQRRYPRRATYRGGDMSDRKSVV